MPGVMESSPAIVRYEGSSPGTEIWGYTQANFLVAVPGRHAKESAILLNEPAARYMMAELGLDDSTETRETLARLVGEAWYPRAIERGGDIESIVTVSRAFLVEHPEILATVRKALG
jgi:hypothetical protein